jgi:hypothetical protein
VIAVSLTPGHSLVVAERPAHLTRCQYEPFETEQQVVSTRRKPINIGAYTAFAPPVVVYGLTG